MNDRTLVILVAGTVVALATAAVAYLDGAYWVARLRRKPWRKHWYRSVR